MDCPSCTKSETPVWALLGAAYTGLMTARQVGGMDMFYVYARHTKTGRENYVGAYDTEKEAVHKIASCYRIDAKTCQEDEYYYFLKKR